jgi:hypothetical protein
MYLKKSIQKIQKRYCKDLSNKEMQVQEECVTDKKKTSTKDNDAVRALTMPILSQAFKLIWSTKSHFEWKGMKQY